MIILYDKDQLDTRENYDTRSPIAFLDHAKSCVVTEERNGMYELSMEYPKDGPAYPFIEEKCIISAGPYIDAENDWFRIYDVSKTLNGDLTVSAAHISYDLSKLPFIPYRLQTSGTTKTSLICTATDLSGAIQLFNDSIIMALNDKAPPFKMESDFNKTANMTVTGVSSIRSLIGGEDSSMLSIYGGELAYDRLNIYILKERGADNGVTIEYGKNITDLRYDKNAEETHNCIYPFFVMDDDISQGFSEFDVDEPEEEEASDKNDGLKHWDLFRLTKYLNNQEAGFPSDYLEYVDDYLYVHPKDTTVVARRAYMLDCTDVIRENVNKDEYVVPSTFDGYAKALIGELVLEAMKEMTANIFDPKIEMDVSFEMLSQFPEYQGIEFAEHVNLCDTVTVRVPHLGITTKAKCIKTEYNALENRYDNITISTDWDDLSGGGVSDTIAQLSQDSGKKVEKNTGGDEPTPFTALDPLISYGRKTGSTVGDHSIAVGENVIASGKNSQAFGYNCDAYGDYSHAEGSNTLCSRNSHAEGEESEATGSAAHAEGYDTVASGDYSHAEGQQTTSIGAVSHAEGYFTQAYGDYSHAEGFRDSTSANGSSGIASHSEGYNTSASGKYSHAEGKSSKSIGESSHAEGYQCSAQNESSHAEGYRTKAIGSVSHAEGYSTEASNSYSHAEGTSSKASGITSHAEGDGSISSGRYSHAEGRQSESKGQTSHAEGWYTIATSENSHVEGKNNIEDADKKYAHIIGNGYSNTTRSNAHTVDWDGNAWYAGAVTSTGADYAEYVSPWWDDNPGGEDRVGYFVTAKNGKLYKANREDYILGVTSGSPSILGNADGEYHNRWVRDVFGRIQKDEEGNRTQSKNYDSSLQQSYILRKDRPEWDYVGMLGVLPVRDDGSCEPGSFCICGGDGLATNYSSMETSKRAFYVLERLNDHVIKIMIR